MINICPENERAKHKYLDWLHEAKQWSPGTVDVVQKSLHRYEEFTQHANFKDFNKDTAKNYKRYLKAVPSRSGGTLSLSMIDQLLKTVKDMFVWLAQQPGYRSKISLVELEYFNLSENEKRAAKAPGRRKYPSVEQANQVINFMPKISLTQKRDSAILALLLLTGIRGGALVTLRMKHIKPEEYEVHQDPKEVATKFRKQIITYFFPVGATPLRIFLDYYAYMKDVMLFGPDDPLFPMSEIIFEGPRGMKAKLSRKPWSDCQSVTKIVKRAFLKVGLSDYSPHAIRHTLAAYGELVCKTPEEWKAWSQNLGHTHTLTTFDSYGHMAVNTQAAVISKLWRKQNAPNAADESEMMNKMYKMMVKITQHNALPNDGDDQQANTDATIQ